MIKRAAVVADLTLRAPLSATRSIRAMRHVYLGIVIPRRFGGPKYYFGSLFL